MKPVVHALLAFVVNWFRSRLSLQPRARCSETIASIRKGINHSALRPSRAMSNPLSVLFDPPQLNCTHGRKKQIKTINAKLVVTPLLFMTLSLCCFLRLIAASYLILPME